MLSVWVSVWVSDCVYRFKRKAFTSHTHTQRERVRNVNESRKLLHDDNWGRGMAPWLPSAIVCLAATSSAVMSHENNATILQLLPKTNFAFYLTGFSRNFAAGKGRDRRRLTAKKSGEWRTGESKKERRGDNMTCGLLQQTIPIKCDIRDRDNIQMSRVNKNSRWVSWTAKTIKTNVLSICESRK